MGRAGDLRRRGTEAPGPEFETAPTAGLSLAVSVDDVRPERGFGGERERGPLGFLMRLYEQLGCRATLFVPTDWQGRLPLREHLDWLGRLREQPCFEVACHGHLHAAAPGSADPGEFRGIDAETAEARVRQSLDVFAEAGCKPLGFKAPGWFLEPSAYAVLDRHFRYIAGHVIGTEASRLQGGRLLRLPYLHTIDRIGPWPDAGLRRPKRRPADRADRPLHRGLRLDSRIVVVCNAGTGWRSPLRTMPHGRSRPRSCGRRGEGRHILPAGIAGAMVNDSHAMNSVQCAPDGAAAQHCILQWQGVPGVRKGRSCPYPSGF